MHIASAQDKTRGGQTEDTQRKKNALAREIIIQETDLRKIQQEKIHLETEFRRLKKETERIEATMKDAQMRLKETDEEIRKAEEFIRGLKKKLNLL